MTAADMTMRISKVCADSDQTFKVDTGLVKVHNRDLAKTIAMTSRRLGVNNVKMGSGAALAHSAQDSFIVGHKDLSKTRLCVNIIKKGKCYLGSRCEFAHSESEIQKLPNLSKTQLCTKFMNGNCANTNCSFAHGEEELVNRPGFKKKMCVWFAQGKCRNGSSCGFIHDGVDNLHGVDNLPTPSQVMKREASTKLTAKLTTKMAPCSTKLTGKLTTNMAPWRKQQPVQDDVDSDASTDVPSRVPSDDEAAMAKKTRPTMQSSCVKPSRRKDSTVAKRAYQFESRAALGVLVAAAILTFEWGLRTYL